MQKIHRITCTIITLIGLYVIVGNIAYGLIGQPKPMTIGYDKYIENFEFVEREPEPKDAPVGVFAIPEFDVSDDDSAEKETVIATEVKEIEKLDEKPSDEQPETTVEEPVEKPKIEPKVEQTKVEKPKAKPEQPKAPVLPAYTPTAHTGEYMSEVSLNMRSGPSTDYPVVGTLSPYQKAVASEKATAEGSSTAWYKITVNGVTGWSSSNYLTAYKENAKPKQTSSSGYQPMRIYFSGRSVPYKNGGRSNG